MNGFEFGAISQKKKKKSSNEAPQTLRCFFIHGSGLIINCAVTVLFL